MNPTVLNNITYGMYAIGVKDGNKASACIINSVTQLSKGQVSRIAITIRKDTYSCECIRKSGIFTISVLSENTPGTIIGALGLVSGRYTEKLRNVRHKVLAEGVPVIKENTCCWFLCEVENTMDIDEQCIIAAKIIAGSDSAVGKPMTYDYYLNVVGGSAPVDVPMYIVPDATVNGHGGEEFVCSVCGYVYNDPNFSFEELSDDWKCPVCKMSKKAYIRKIK